MGSDFNFRNYENEALSNGHRPLMRQLSVYSLTFDEFQTTLGGIGKDFGSMNMDELRKSIWSAEETQSMSTAANGTGQEGINQGGYLQRQGSLTLPRALSNKTVDQVWGDMSKDYYNGVKIESDAPQRQQTLGEMTLEEFLMRAGVVREDTQLVQKRNSMGIFGDLTRSNNNNNSEFGISFQQLNQISMQPANLPLNVNGVRSSQQQQRQQLQPLFPKQTAASYAPADPARASNLVQSVAFQGGLRVGPNGIPTGSPATLSSTGLATSNGDTSSVSPHPYVLNGGLGGRKRSNAVEEVGERRQRRMIKNRESAVRSRERKQAYTTELEQEVAKLKEENQELRKKQEEIMEMQKDQ